MKKIPLGRRIGLLLFAALVVAADQLTKTLVVRSIPFGGQVALLPGVVHLTYVRNSGAAFSMLGGARWLFLALLAVFLVVLGWMVATGVLEKPVELWSLAAIAGGAVGNGIDRLRTGEVVDMIEVEFVRFAVFNVADMFITCGAIVLAVYLLFFDRKKESETHGTAS